MKNYDTIVFIGRFQPLHTGHVEVIKQAMIRAKKNFLILVGSTNGPRNFKNPFTYEQRRGIIEGVVNNELRDFGPDANVSIQPLKDSKYNNEEWIEQVQEKVSAAGGQSVAIIGYKKDETSQYLGWFPQWDYIPVDFVDDAAVVDATTVRNILFEGLNPGFFRGVLPKQSYDFLEYFKTTDEYARIKEEYEVVKAYKKSWEAAPYPPTFVCSDAVVFCAGHVLLIERGAQPGKGQWALPGGFLDQNESVFECAVRELIEETKIDIPRRVLEGSTNRVGVVFDAPSRSMRGRTISHAFRFDVEPAMNGKLPKVKGSDDAAKARWVPLSALNEDKIFEDHFAIIHKMMGV